MKKEVLDEEQLRLLKEKRQQKLNVLQQCNGVSKEETPSQLFEKVWAEIEASDDANIAIQVWSQTRSGYTEGENLFSKFKEMLKLIM